MEELLGEVAIPGELFPKMIENSWNAGFAHGVECERQVTLEYLNRWPLFTSRTNLALYAYSVLIDCASWYSRIQAGVFNEEIEDILAQVAPEP